MTIRSRLLATYLLLTALGMSLLAGYLVWRFRVYILSTEKADLSALATAVSKSIADALERGDRERVHTLVERWATGDRVNIRVIGADGRLLASSTPGTDRSVADWRAAPGVAAGLNGTAAGGVEDVRGSRTDVLYEVRPMHRRGQLLGVARVTLRLEQFQRLYDNVLRTIMVGIAVAFGVCALISMAFARSIAQPIQAMRNFAVRVGGGHFREALDIQRRDELGELATELNRMSERLASLDEERRAFLANVSHELRTPVSNVQLTLEALETGADEEPALRARFMRTALDETSRLTILIQDLLELGRLEAGVAPMARERVLLPGVIARATRAMETRLRANRLTVEVSVPDVEVQGDPERLLQALLNVLDNAIKFSRPGSTVSVTGRHEGSCVALQIRDQGPGIRDADLPHVFEQFYTGDRSRKRGGTGLGLAIARRIIEAHGGTISARSTEGKGATFTIELPVETAPGLLTGPKTARSFTKA